ncbi:MAG: DUF2461 domain-containing protein [Bacteroidia bacterium]|nr:DUF2461 domain-containing protein [Bacteroidia bacterium]
MDANNIIRFLNELRANNNKNWFDANRKWYEDVKSDFFEFSKELIAGVSKFDSRINNLDIKDCTYRINRDIRFRNDKSPYKTHLGTFICPQGKKSGFGGYYFHIEPQGGDYLGNHLMAVGAYCPEKNELDSIRTEIYDNPEKFIHALNEAKGFKFDESSKLKKNPKSYPADFKYIEYLKYKNYCIEKDLSEKDLQDPNLLEMLLDNYKSAHTFNEIINKSIEYIRENP